jgi:hypothetical protein
MVTAAPGAGRQYADATKTAFKSATRLECMMQDFPYELPPGSRVGFTTINQVRTRALHAQLVGWSGQAGAGLGSARSGWTVTPPVQEHSMRRATLNSAGKHVASCSARLVMQVMFPERISISSAGLRLAAPLLADPPHYPACLSPAAEVNMMVL